MVNGEYMAKTGTQGATPVVGDYVLLRSGYWARVEAGGLYSGPYKTTDGVNFTLVS